MARLDANNVSIEVSSFCSDNCRYDRHGRGGEPPLANPLPDRWLYKDGGDAVLFDDPGSGVLSRIWLTSGGPTPICLNPAMRLKLYFDGAATPQFDMPLAQVFDGSTPPFTAPLVFDKDQGSGGYASYVPIAYANGLRVAVGGLDESGPCSGATPPLLWYQLDAQRLPPGSVTSNFSVSDTHSDMRAFLAAQGSDPWQRGLPPSSASTLMAPGQVVTLASEDGSGWLAGVQLKVDAAVWSTLRLQIDIDGDTRMSLPLSRAFSVQSQDTVAARSPLFGLDAQGWLYLWWPMPYRHQLAVKLVGTNLVQAVTVQSRVTMDSAPVPSDSGSLHAFANEQCGHGVDHQLDIMSASGSGRLMALSGLYSATTGNDPRYLEGDVRIAMDQRQAPVWQGSGLEDFFNGGFYFNWGAPYRQAWSGAGRVDVQGQSSMWRLLLGDAPTFVNGMQLLQEAGASPDEPVSLCADTVAWSYQSPERSLVPVAQLDVGKASDRMRYDYQLPAVSTCSATTAAFADAAATLRTGVVCRHESGQSHFHVQLADAPAVLRLRRTVDAATPGQAARIDINGVTAGWFPPVRPDSVRRWQTQDAPLRVPANTMDFGISIVPLWGKHGDSGSFTASIYELWAPPGDRIFRSGFEVGGPVGSAASISTTH